MKRFFKALMNDPLVIFNILILFVTIFVKRMYGFKTVVYNLHHDYFYDLFKDIHKDLIKKNVCVYFSIDHQSNDLRDYLVNNGVPASRIINNTVSPFLPFDMFICAEVTGPDFPLKIFRTKKVQIYHGTGVYNLYEKTDILTRFDIHFAIGPNFNKFIEFAYKKHQLNSYRIYNTGYPKTDRVFFDSGTDISKKYKTDKMQTVLYAPHWNESGSLFRFDRSIIEILAHMDAVVLIKAHNYLYTKYPEKNWKRTFEEFSNKYHNIKIASEPDTQLLYPAADLMITDTGTTAAMEFSLLKKPLIVFRNDSWFDNKEHVSAELDILNTALCFTSLSELKSTVSGVLNAENIAEIEEQKLSQEKLTSKHIYNRGTATKAAVEAILTELGIGK